jgi:iron(II)-dependent oxidoreductase
MKNLSTELKLELAGTLGCAIVLSIGLATQNTLATLMAGVCLGILGQRWVRRFMNRGEAAEVDSPVVKAPSPAAPVEAPRSRPDRSTAYRKSAPRKRRREPVSDPTEFVETMIADGRYALLLRPEVVPNLSSEQLKIAIASLHEEMAFVPDGDVKMGCADNSEEDTSQSHHATSVFVDRYPVTNAVYKQFVDDGGYESEEYWDEGVFTGVANFVDQTGCAGPRYWTHGTYPSGLGDHPVVGVSWFEASACARWMGKRLAAGPEWVKAAAWPVTGPDGQIQQRKYPWGDRFGEGMANTWASGIGGTVSVFEFNNGASMSGGHQFVGNVWEWMGDDAHIAHQESDVARSNRIKAIRGGAFDTYFENQATCHFESGDDPFARKHNIGFRCVVTADELAAEVRQEGRKVSLGHSENDAITANHA